MKIIDVHLISYFDGSFLRNSTKIDFKYKLQIVYGKSRDKFALEQTMKVQRGSRGVAFLFLEPLR